MDESNSHSEPPSLLGITIRRSIISGKIYLGVGIGLSLFFAIVFSLAAGPAIATTLPFFLPLYSVMGAMGGLMVFTNDRLKGVFEYLVAYGVSARRLFENILVASLVLVLLVLGPTMAVALGIYVGTGHSVSLDLVEALGLYTLPMSLASTAFAATLGMFWTSLSSPREGMNSPIGVIPIVGVTPPLVTLIAAELVRAEADTIAIGAVTLVAVFVLLLIRLMDRLMPRERLLSPG
jgi:hypothetical protein